MPDEITISTHAPLLQLDWICEQLKASYWGGAYTDDQIRHAVANSICFGAYLHGIQVGLVRAVSDCAIFSSITDVIVEERYRGRGYGTALIKAAVADPRIGKTYCILKARPEAWLWYFSAADFHVFDKRGGLMQRMPQ